MLQKQNKSLHYNTALRAIYIKKEHRLLICDDEPDLLELCAAMLNYDYKIVKAASCEECIRKYIEAKEKMGDITVILLDFRI